MCTVSFVPLMGNVLITASRDERAGRPAAIPPRRYSLDCGDIIFPKDGEAGGTWFGLHTLGHAAVLLNGAWKNHVTRLPYLKSRGLVLLDILNAKRPVDFFKQIDLEGIEPFTIVLWDGRILQEGRWDGEQKYFRTLDAGQSHIWSSPTLYDASARSKRQKWFHEWLALHPTPNQKSILDFHLFAGEGDPAVDLKMNRNEKLFTVSITSLWMNKKEAGLVYLDLQNGRPAVSLDIIFSKKMVINQ